MKNSEQTVAKLIADIERIIPLVDELQKASSLGQKIKYLNENAVVKNELAGRPLLKSFLDSAEPVDAAAILQVIALGQSKVVFGDDDNLRTQKDKFQSLVDILKKTDSFYEILGGIAGYHLMICQKIVRQLDGAKEKEDRSFLVPPVWDLRDNANQKRLAVRWGVDGLPNFAEIYVLGGAADRLCFRHPETDLPLPAAIFPYSGFSLLEMLIRDLQAREYLYYKLHGRQVQTPVLIMISLNPQTQHIVSDYCANKDWFGRSPSSFKIISQPLVPMLSIDGAWCASEPFTLHLRPGGHGALWRCIELENAFNWLSASGRQCALIRQVNNPIANVDGNLLAFGGIGWHENKVFGFASCEREEGAAEGINILTREEDESSVKYAITNLEYTDHPKSLDPPAPGWKDYPANTNILFVNLRLIRQVIERNPFPGLIVNLKTKVKCLGEEKVSARLESLMQNLADGILSKNLPKDAKLKTEHLPTFIKVDYRNKTITPIKKSHEPGMALQETPQGAFLVHLQNSYDLLKKYCGMEVPLVGDEADYLSNNWGFLFYYHPALGPVYEVIAQKIRGGTIKKGSDLDLEIAELELINLDLEGSLSVIAENVMTSSEDGSRRYSHKTGKCVLRNVTVRNAGIDKSSCESWKKSNKHTEALQIIINGDGEFYAQNVEFIGAGRYVVPSGHRMHVSQEISGIKISMQKITMPSWWWHYAFAADGTLVLRKLST